MRLDDIRQNNSQHKGHARMSSSPTAPADTNSTRRERLVHALESVPDPRARRGRRYRLTPVLALAVTAQGPGMFNVDAV